MKDKNRRNLIQVYGHLYQIDKKCDCTLCVYCNESSTCYDHVPPLSRLLSLNITEYLKMNLKFVLLPACSECNLILSNKELYTLYDRLQYLYDKYLTKVNQTEWTRNELSEVTGNLKKYIRHKQAVMKYYKNKLTIIKLKLLTN